MATSLFQQLERLKVPQTLALLDNKRKPSILFDYKEAANKDRRTIYDIGVAGLKELIILNPIFKEFKETLFNETTLQMERAVEQKNINELLDLNIRKFFHYLSPYIMLRPAHMCLEWLIRRFQIEKYNRNDMLAMILPYHETNVFVKLLQTLHLREVDTMWFWLKVQQKAGKPLSKTALLNRAATERGFFKFICDTTLAAIKELEINAYLLQAQINFYGSVVVGALEYAKDIAEWHITALLPSLLSGLNSSITDFVAASYIITSRLLARTQVTEKLCNALVKRIVAVKNKRLQHTAVPLLVHIFATQMAMQNYQFPDETFLYVIQQKWFLEILNDLAKENLDIQEICKCLMKQCVESIKDKTNTNTAKYQNFLENLFNSVQFPYNTACQLISYFLDCYDCKDDDNGDDIDHTFIENIQQDNDIIDLDSDDDDMENGYNNAQNAVKKISSEKNFQLWYSQFLSKLEHQYPNAFDAVLKESLANTNLTTKQRSKAIKMILGHRLQITNDMASDIYETLYHHTANIRLIAVKTLLNNLNDYRKRPDNLRILAQCLVDRLNDDCADVVKEILKLSTVTVLQVMDCKRFIKNLMEILYKIQIKPKQWSNLIVPILKHLTDQLIIQQCDNNILLLILMAILYPIGPMESSDNCKDIVTEIFSSNLQEKLPFLKCLKIDLTNFNVKDYKKELWHVISTWKMKPNIMDFLKSIENECNNEETCNKDNMDIMDKNYYFKHAVQLHHFLILIIAYLQPTYTVQESYHIFQQIQKYLKSYKFRYLKTDEWTLVNHLKYIPIHLLNDFLCTLIKCTNFSRLQKYQQQQQQQQQQQECPWELALAYNAASTSVSVLDDSAGELLYILNIFEIVAEGAFDVTLKLTEQREWMKILKQIFDILFEKVQDKIEFFCNFFLYEEHHAYGKCLKDFSALRVKSFKILENLCKNPSNTQMNFNMEEIMKICRALESPIKIIRLEALNILEIIYKKQLCNKINHQIFVLQILERKEAIIMDNEQFPLILYTILNTKSNNIMKMKMKMKMKIFHMDNNEFQSDLLLEEILQLIMKDEDLKRPYLMARLMHSLKFINDDINYDIFQKFIPKAIGALKYYVEEGSIKLLKPPYDLIYNLVIERFNEKTIENILIDNCEAWRLINMIFERHDVFVNWKNTLKPLPNLFLETINELIYEKMPMNYKTDFIRIIIQTISVAENVTIFLAVNKLLKKCWIDCKPLVEILENMKKSFILEQTFSKKSIENGTQQQQSKEKQKQQMVTINTCNWKDGIALLELMENKKKLLHTDLMIPAIFDIINSCLLIDDQTNVEYCKQLCLTALLNCLQLAEENGCELNKTLPKSLIRIDQIVQCLSASPNPQTHRNALLLLSYCAGLFPEQVLHNIVHIFTFMGTSVIRHDDAFSFHIINDIITTIVPTLVKEQAAIIPVMKVFSDIILDVPEHRRLPLYTKLIDTLGANKTLWIFLCVAFDAHVIHDEKQRLLNKKLNKSSMTNVQLQLPSNEDASAKRIEILLELCEQFTPDIILETCIQLMHYMKDLPMDKCDKDKMKQLAESLLPDNIDETLFDANIRTDKQLRHYKYIIVQFISMLTQNKEFLQKISLLTPEELLTMKPLYQNFIIKILSYIPIVNEQYEKLIDNVNEKFWKVLLNYLHEILDNAINLLSADMFLIVVTGLMQHQLLSVRKKVIELLINKLQQKDDFFANCNQQNFENLLKPLMIIIDSILIKCKKKKDKNKVDDKDEMMEDNNNYETIHFTQDMIYLQQTALIALKVLSKYFALNYIDIFQELLANLIKIAKHRTDISKIILATVLLTMIEISTNLRAHSLEYLPKFMPHLLDVLQDQVVALQQKPPDNVCLAIVAGMQKLFQVLPLFLDPYMTDILIMLSSIEALIQLQLECKQKDQRSQNAIQKVKGIWLKIATDVPLRILVPNCQKVYHYFMAKYQYNEIIIIMKLLQKSIEHNSNHELSTIHKDLVQLFMETIEFRIKVKMMKKKKQCTMAKIDEIENIILSTWVTWILKLSESSFRPLYHNLYKWAMEFIKQKEAILTYFRLTAQIADALKSLFILFAHEFIDHVGNILNDCNSNKSMELDGNYNEEYISIEILLAIFKTLYQIFLHDNKEFLNLQRFELIMGPLVNQLENRLILENDAIQEQLVKCISQLAVDVSNDVMWKQLNYQVLLKTRTNIPEVRILAFNCCLEIARKLGDDFSALLPETIPFIAELFEDDHPRVENNTRKVVQEMEIILGESLQKYL